MSQFDLATGVVTFKGDVSQFEEDLKKSEAKLKDLNKALETGGFKMQLFAAKAFNRELMEANRQTKRLMMEVQYGKLGARFREAMPGMRQFGRGALQAGAAGVALGAGAVAMASQASPLAGDTLDKSFKLFKTVVGGTFIPMVMDLSFALQDAAKWWKGLSSQIKENIAGVTKMIAMTGAATLAFGAVSTVLAFIAKNPLVAALGALAGGAGAIASNNQSDKVGKAQRDIYSTTLDDAMKSQVGVELSMLKPEEAKKRALENFNSSWAAAEASRREHESIAGNSFLAGSSRITETLTGDSRESVARKNATEQFKKLEESKFLLQKFGDVKLPERKEGGGGAGKRGDLGISGPASFTQASELLRSIQLSAAGTSPLDQQIVAQQKANELLTQIEANTKKDGAVVR